MQFDQLKALTADKPIVDAPCPSCGPECRSEANSRRKVLRIWDDGDFISFKCARCDASGWAKDGAARHIARERPKIEEPRQDKAATARFLWARSLPLPGSAAEAYLRSRGCFSPSPNLRFLPARDRHPPAMIARFGDEDVVTGVHITRLREDGSGKAGTDADKLIIGPSIGKPIIIRDNPDREELIIAEGIEDALSFAVVTGWSTWAAGTANRIPRVLAAAKGFPKVYCAVDLDFGKKMRAGPRAFDQARAVRSDLIPLRIEKVLGLREKLDANKALIRFGHVPLLAAIEWCEIQELYARGEIGLHAMQAEMAGVNRIFQGLTGLD